jgi:tetratricopeptide (TPR) repeat protein
MAGVTKRYPASLIQRRGRLIPLAGLLFVGAMFLQNRIDPSAKELRKSQKIFEASSGLTSEFMLLPLLGFREAAAGLLWVRCDEFFHSGDYDAILPLVRLITWLDPHADNVYITGAWHLAYNFTDSNERSDRRYISPSQRFLKEGVRNNMNIPDIKFELGWQNYDKVKDYFAAREAFMLALETKPHPSNDDYPYGAPLKTHHILAHTYARMGRIPDAIAEWDRALARSTEMLKKPDQLKGTQNEFSIKMMQAAENNNKRETLQRWRDRYTPDGHSQVNPTKYPAVLAPPGGQGAPRPWDVSFKPKVEVVRERVIKVSGNVNMADGARIDVKLTDWDFEERKLGDIREDIERFDVDPTQTIMQEAISVRKNKFEREIDMSKDPKMYNFSKPTYKLTLSFNPRATSPHVQDRFGYNGEGMMDSNQANIFYDRRPELMGTKMIEGQNGDGPVWDGKTVPWPQYGQPLRLLRVTYKVSREQLFGQKPITSKDIVPNE